MGSFRFQLGLHGQRHWMILSKRTTASMENIYSDVSSRLGNTTRMIWSSNYASRDRTREGGWQETSYKRGQINCG